MTVDAQGNATTKNYSATGALTGSTVQLTNAAGGVVTNSYDANSNALGSSVQLTDAAGNVMTTSYAGLNGAGSRLSDTWSKPDGSYGADTYNTDGSHTATTTDAAGNVLTNNYATTGVLTSDSWSKTDGSHGSVDFYADGRSIGSTYNADGSHSGYLNDGQNHITTSGSYTASADLAVLMGVGVADLTLTGGDQTAAIVANSGNDTLVATNATSILIGGAGRDTFQLGAGQYEIQNANTKDQIILSGVSSDELWFQAQGNNLVVSVLGTSEKITVDNWYAGNQVGTLIDGGGQSIGGTDIARLVQAMAAFAPPAAGQLSYTAAEQQALAPMLASSWHH